VLATASEPLVAAGAARGRVRTPGNQLFAGEDEELPTEA
jgi:hypothetical protein